MGTEILVGKKILIVDDEPDILATASDTFHQDTEIVTASSFDEARDLIDKQTFDLVILDIMGVDGFALLEACKKNKLPAAMFTAHSMNIESLNRAGEMGAVSFLPKEELFRLPELVAEILEDLSKGQTHWVRLFKRLGSFFRDSLGVVWEDDKESGKKFPKTFHY